MPIVTHRARRALPWTEMTARWRPWAILTVLCLALWLPGFFSLPPGDRDESRFALATHQMLESGDFIDIRNGAVARNQKPIGIYWMQVPFVAAARALGLAQANPVWPYRIPSLLGGLTAVLATFGFGRRLAGPRAALAGAAFLAGSLVLTAEVHIAKTDAALLGATTVAMGLLSRAWLEPARMTRAAALGFWTALAVTILLKGPVGPMVVVLTLAALATPRWRRALPPAIRALRPGLGLPLLVVLVLPWFVAIGLATHGAFFTQSVGGDLAGKLAGGDDAHGAPPGLHLLLAPVLLFAAGAPAIAAIPAVWRHRSLPETRFMLCWLVPAWLVFEAVPTKLPHYTLPLYPALALLTANWVLAASPAPRWLARFACAASWLAVLGIGAAAVALPYVVAADPRGFALAGLPTAVLCGMLLACLAVCFPDPRRTAWTMLAAAPLLFGSLEGYELPRVTPLWLAPRVAALLRAHWPAGRPGGAAFGAYGFAEPSLVFLCGSETDLVSTEPVAAAFLLGGPDHVLAVADPKLPALVADLDARGAATRILGEVGGFNYSNGRRVRLVLMTATPAAQRMK
jgi:4-amino-4-deoxy-L-arabinose transferase-like glycosyltransferase